MSRQTPITDSPWFWFTLFPAVGLVALLATGGKFRDRQVSVEQKGQARAALADGSVEVAEDATGRKTAKGVPDYSKPGETQVQLVPLSILLATICTVSFVLLVRERRRMVSME